MSRTFDEHQALVLTLAEQLNAIIRGHEVAIGLSAVLLVAGAALSTVLTHHNTDDSAPEWARVLVPLVRIALEDIAADSAVSPTSRPH